MCLQLYVEKALLDEAQPGGFDTIKAAVDVGDIVGVSGGLKRTDKGELSVMVSNVQASGLPKMAQREGAGSMAAEQATIEGAAAGAVSACEHWMVSGCPVCRS